MYAGHVCIPMGQEIVVAFIPCRGLLSMPLWSSLAQHSTRIASDSYHSRAGGLLLGPCDCY